MNVESRTLTKCVLPCEHLYLQSFIPFEMLVIARKYGRPVVVIIAACVSFRRRSRTTVHRHSLGVRVHVPEPSSMPPSYSRAYRYAVSVRYYFISSRV